MNSLFDIMDHTVEHPLNVYFDLSPHGKVIQALLGSNIPKDWFLDCGVTTVAMESTGGYWIPLFAL
jgi:hypothetical protein